MVLTAVLRLRLASTQAARLAFERCPTSLGFSKARWVGSQHLARLHRACTSALSRLVPRPLQLIPPGSFPTSVWWTSRLSSIVRPRTCIWGGLSGVPGFSVDTRHGLSRPEPSGAGVRTHRCASSHSAASRSDSVSGLDFATRPVP